MMVDLDHKFDIEADTSAIITVEFPREPGDIGLSESDGTMIIVMENMEKWPGTWSAQMIRGTY